VRRAGGRRPVSRPAVTCARAPSEGRGGAQAAVLACDLIWPQLRRHLGGHSRTQAENRNCQGALPAVRHQDGTGDLGGVGVEGRKGVP
jgi:hypothetical protein